MKLKLKEMLLISIFSALMVVGAYLRIPFPVLSITFQPFFCALAGLILGSKLSLYSQLVYIMLGLVGLPVFTNGGGPLYILQPSFGFILGFAACAYIIGKLSEGLKTFNIGKAIVCLMSGLAAIYSLGIPYMYIILVLYLKKPGISIIYLLGLNLPFFIKDLVLYIVIAIFSITLLPVIKKTGISTVFSTTRHN
jgi:Uncharacterized conserved protein